MERSKKQAASWRKHLCLCQKTEYRGQRWKPSRSWAVGWLEEEQCILGIIFFNCEFWIYLPFLLCLGCYLAIKELRAKCTALLFNKWARISSIAFCVLTSLQHYSILFFSGLIFLCPNFLLILYLLLWFYELPQFLIGKKWIWHY